MHEPWWDGSDPDDDQRKWIKMVQVTRRARGAGPGGIAAAACAAAAVLSACTVIESRSLFELNGRQPRGISYTLGKAIVLVRARVVEKHARFIVCVSDAIATMDSAHQYVAAWRNNPLAADKIDVETQPDSSVLKKLNVKSVDQSDQFVLELAKGFGAAAGYAKREAFQVGADCTGAKIGDDPVLDLADLHVDPGDESDVQRKMSVVNTIAHTFAGTRARACRSTDPALAGRLGAIACDEYLRLERIGHQRPLVRMSWRRPRVPEGLPRPDCSVGICYRPRLSYMLEVEVAGIAMASHPYSLPNNSPLLAMDVTRGIAITKTTNIQFDAMGQPTTIMLQKGDDNGGDGAEAVELAKLPAAVIDAYFSAFAATLSKITTALGNQSQLYEAKGTLLKKRQDYEEALRKARKEQADLAREDQHAPVFVMGVSSGPKEAAARNDTGSVAQGSKQKDVADPGKKAPPKPEDKGTKAP